MKHKPTVLIILDGWGVKLPSRANAITSARTPFFDSLIATYPTTTLQASGEATGLPWGEAGNSEVGHANIGAGRIVYQELSRINAAIRSGSFFSNTAFENLFTDVKKRNGALHLIGLLSPGGVHSHSDHLYALLEIAKQMEIEKLFVHAILDGRDTPYASGIQYIERLEEKLESTPWKIASISGRYYAMDRDNHWDRTEKAYNAITQGIGMRSSDSPLHAISAAYEASNYDEEFLPTVITDNGIPRATMKEGDAILFTNIRADRMRQIVAPFVNDTFDKFERISHTSIAVTTLTEYDKTFQVPVAFPPQQIKNCLAEVVSNHKLKQLHIAETEKYAHITYFLNAGREEPFPNEKRIMIPSPAVESYDKKPEMSGREITEGILKAMENEEYDFIAVNFANADMVGHTGNMKATMQAIETIDECFRRIIPAVLQKNGAVLITSDHGNAEELLDLQTGKIDKEHNNNPVPCIIIAKELEGKALSIVDPTGKDLSVIEASGLLSDVAPTILELMSVPKPQEMTGRSILETN